MDTEEFSFVSLLLITALAATVPLLASRFKRFRIPIVVGEIIAGMIVGKSGLDLVETGPALQFLTIFGFTYLMFLSGLEVDFTVLISASGDGKKQSKLSNPLTLGSVVFGLTLVIGLLAAVALWYLGFVTEPFFIALILSTTSLGIVVPVLKERGLLPTKYGQALLMTALVADFGTLMLITATVVIFSDGLTLEVLLVLVLIAAFAAAVRVGQWFSRIPGLTRIINELSHATAQIKVRGAVALMVAFIVLSEWLGAELILGAFLAGAAISLLSKREGSDLHMKMDAIGFGFFIPIFFIMVGVQFDLPALLSSFDALLLVPLLLVIAYVIKFVAVLPFRFNFSWRKTWAAGGLMSARLSLIIAAAAIAYELGAIDDALNSAIILVAIVTCTASPLLFNRLMPAKASESRQGVILVGFGELSQLLAERLQQDGEQVIVVGSDRGRGEQVRRRGINIIDGDPASAETLAQAGAHKARALIGLSTYDDVNFHACTMAADEFGVPHLIARSTDAEVALRLTALGVRVIRPQLATMLALEGALLFPSAFDMLSDNQDGVEVREVALNNPTMHGHLMREVHLPGDALALGVRRGGEVLVPHGDTRLRNGDVLMLVGHPDALQEARMQLSPNRGDDFGV